KGERWYLNFPTTRSRDRYSTPEPALQRRGPGGEPGPLSSSRRGECEEEDCTTPLPPGRRAGVHLEQTQDLVHDILRSRPAAHCLRPCETQRAVEVRAALCSGRALRQEQLPEDAVAHRRAEAGGLRRVDRAIERAAEARQRDADFATDR